MQTIHIQVEDNKLNTFLTLIDNLKDGIVKNVSIQTSELENDYITSEQFQKDKEYFQQCLTDIENGKTQTISHDEVWNNIENHIQAS